MDNKDTIRIYFNNRKELLTTIKELKDIPNTAMYGGTCPSTAKGIIMVL